MTTTVVTVGRVEAAAGTTEETARRTGGKLRLPETTGAGQSTAMIMYGDICGPV